jgi:hypothetical protein
VLPARPEALGNAAAEEEEEDEDEGEAAGRLLSLLLLPAAMVSMPLPPARCSCCGDCRLRLSLSPPLAAGCDAGSS